MSYNIGHIEVINCVAACMLAKDVKRLAARDDLAESNFIEELARKEPDSSGYVLIDSARFWWSGEGSGRSWHDVFIKKVAPKIVGTIEAIVTWEGGDTHSGLRIRNGEVTEPDVVMTLAEDK